MQLRVTAVTTPPLAELLHLQQEQPPQHRKDGGEMAIFTSTLRKTWPHRPMHSICYSSMAPHIVRRNPVRLALALLSANRHAAVHGADSLPNQQWRSCVRV